MESCSKCGGLGSITMSTIQPYLDLAAKLENNSYQIEENQYHSVQAVLRAARADATTLRQTLDHIQHLYSAATRAIPIIAMSLAPVRQLPNEVLVQIFERFAPCAENEWDPVHLWLLSHVCSRWRNIILNTSRWWSTIAYICSPSHLTNSSRLAMQMQLSKSQPLHVIIQDYRPSPKEYRTLLGTFTNVLWLHFFRINSAAITTFAETLPLIFSPSNTICTFSSLTHLTLTLHETETVSKARGLFLTKKETPVLEHVTLCSFITGHVSLPWGQLKTLSLVKCSLNKVIPILPLLSQDKLEEMKLDITFENVESLDSAMTFLSFRVPDILHFPNLRKLSTKFTWIWRTNAAFELQQALLSRFRLPDLRHFSGHRLVLDASRPLALGLAAPSTRHLDLDDLLFTEFTEAEVALASLLGMFNSAKVIRFTFAMLELVSDLVFDVFLNHPEYCSELEQLDIDDLQATFSHRLVEFARFLQERKGCCFSWLEPDERTRMKMRRWVAFGPAVEELQARAESIRRYGPDCVVKCFQDLPSKTMADDIHRSSI
jgi:hypothetical protein